MRRVFVIAISALLLSTGVAQAWEIKTTSDGTPIRWPDGVITVDLAMGAEMHDISRETADSQAIASFGNWAQAMGDRVQIRYAKPETQQLGTKKDNLNVVRWGTEESDVFVDPQALATTYLTYRTSTGEILDADIVVNAVNYEWGIVNENHCGENYDLQNILAHEIGHFLGVAHSPEHEESTMFPSAPRCEIQKRELSDDDVAVATYLYNNIHLEAPEKSDGVDLAGCSSVSGSSMWMAFVLLFLFARQRASERVTRAAQPTLAMAAVLALAAGSAQASTMRYLEPAELAAKAELVVEANVVSQVVRLQKGYPVTISTLQVLRCAQKACPQYVSVSQLGGEVGDIGLQVSGVKHLNKGSKVLVFLRAQANTWKPVARSQGIFQVVAKEQREHLSQVSEQLVRDVNGMGLVGKGTPLRVLPREDFAAVFGLQWQAVPKANR